jgi:large-conductance mechanosensitive channel
MPETKKTTKSTQTTDAKVEVTTTVKGKGSKKHMHKPNVTVFFEADDVMRDQVHGFVGFLREYSVVGLAIGFVAGAQAQSVVKALIDSFITPTFQLFLGGTALVNRKFYLSWGNGSDFYWGKMVYALINLLFVLGTIYLLIKLFKLDKLQKPKS